MLKLRSSLFLFTALACLLCSASFYENDETIIIELCYENCEQSFCSDDFLKNTTLFEHRAQMQKHGRDGGKEERLNLVNKLLKMGFSYEEAMEYCFRGLSKKVDIFCKSVNCEPKDATIKFTPGGTGDFLLTHEQNGLHVDKIKLYKKIIESLKNRNYVKISVEPTVLKPKVYYGELVKWTSKKATFGTNYAQSNKNRKHNIKKALSCFNGMVLSPGEECSFNKTTKQRTKENGYLEANVIVNEEYVESFGGGVCQVSTTLYNALLLSNVQILESHPHSLKSSYVLAGFDAMVNYGSSDLRFRNNFDYPIFIKTWATDSDIFVTIFGKNENNIKIKRSNAVIREIMPKKDKVIVDTLGEYAEKVYYTDETFLKTKSKVGQEVYSYLEYWDNGKMIDKKLIRKQTYKAVDGVVVKGAHLREKKTGDFINNMDNSIDKDMA